MKRKLLKADMLEEAKTFCIKESGFENKSLFGVTDGKAVGTHIEQKFKEILQSKYIVEIGSSANGIDLPGEDICTDIKVTSRSLPQSSCPFKNANQKIFGLGYNLLVFVYDKIDNHETKTSVLNFLSCSYLIDKNIPADDLTLKTLAEQILKKAPELGYLTISNALQWRLQYQRIVMLDTPVDGITKLIDNVKK